MAVMFGSIRRGATLVGVAAMMCAITTTAFAATPSVTFERNAGTARFGNDWMAARWHVADGHLRDLTFRDRVNDVDIDVDTPFALVMDDDSRLGPDAMHLASQPEVVTLNADHDAARLSEREPSRAV